MTTTTKKSGTVSRPKVFGEFVEIGGESHYVIENYQHMAPFLMSVVSSSDLWMYVSSQGGLTAGRVRAENCLFPYEPVDRLHCCHSYTGPLTMFAVTGANGERHIWRPFHGALSRENSLGVTRRLYKHILGNKLIFEESHEQFSLTFKYAWQTSTQFGFVRTCELVASGGGTREIEILDGFQNVLPYGIELSTYYRASCLQDAYKHNQCDAATKLGIFHLTARIHDRAEAIEMQRVNTVWGYGLEDQIVLLSCDQIQNFYEGIPLQEELDITGRRGNYFVNGKKTLANGESAVWYIVGDVAQDHLSVAKLRRSLLEEDSLGELLQARIQQDHHELLKNVASADALQATGHQLTTAHHLANVLFNNMRGGVFASGYDLQTKDFVKFLAVHNKVVERKYHSFLSSLPSTIFYLELLEQLKSQDDADLLRLGREYLPLTFGRRHGDPSRPWNNFEIHVRQADGSKLYNFQGNWRDIFQNWEGLCQSFPCFLPSIISKFVNASTIDGFNPYRISRDGIDWEVIDAEDPWSNIGYWGDHQIIYLSKLLEAAKQHFPGELEELLDEAQFCYANVPYRIKPYSELVKNASDTIQYDGFTATTIKQRVDSMGSDGKLIMDSGGSVYYANLVEKLLVPALSKLSNFVPDGGIWLNTQRPEWNDANNALVGSGLSMVTAYYLRRYLKVFVELLRAANQERVAISVEVEQWYRQIRKVLNDNKSLLHGSEASDFQRRKVLDGLGQAFSDYRLKVYDDGFSGKHSLAVPDLIEFLRLATDYLDHAVRQNRRNDRLYHTYNLMELDKKTGAVHIGRLYEMLEGQVAVISSGALDNDQVIELVGTMFESRLFRDDQQSFMLYPERRLPGFLERNEIPEEVVSSTDLLRSMRESKEHAIFAQDVDGKYHFQPDIVSLRELESRLDALAAEEQWAELVAQDGAAVAEVFGEVFNHKEYTGRSGTMYGYEGLGCIYWHMVSKLLLAVQENFFDALDRQSPDATIGSLGDLYYLVRAGLSSDKAPEQYGAFPTDPYSHSPKHSGAQQPGMTGQVKEEILTRRGEFGLRVRDGRLYFQPILLRRREFLTAVTEFSYFDTRGNQTCIELAQGELAFTVCQVPIVYRLSDAPFSIDVTLAGGKIESLKQDCLGTAQSQSLFRREGQIERIDVTVPQNQISRA